MDMFARIVSRPLVLVALAWSMGACSSEVDLLARGAGAGGADDAKGVPGPTTSSIDEIPIVVSASGQADARGDGAGSEADGERPGTTVDIDTSIVRDDAATDDDTAGMPADGAPAGDGAGPAPGKADKPVLDAKDIAACAKQLGVDVKQVKVAGNQGRLELKADQAIAAKVTGNGGQLRLTMQGSTPIAGLCLFVAGNGAAARVDVAAKLGRLSYIGRGNNSLGQVDVKEGAEIRSVRADVGGNNGRFEIAGAGAYKCEQGLALGNGSEIRCD